jgi:hypothetical protein
MPSRQQDPLPPCQLVHHPTPLNPSTTPTSSHWLEGCASRGSCWGNLPVPVHPHREVGAGSATQHHPQHRYCHQGHPGPGKMLLPQLATQ